MRDDPLPDPHHVARYCSATRCSETGRVTAAAFQLRDHEEYLSVNWLEYLGRPERRAEIEEIRSTLKSKGMRLGQQAKIAVLNVGQVRKHVFNTTPDNRQLRILHQPKDNDPSHSGIFDYQPDDNLIPELIAEKVIETHPAAPTAEVE